MEAKPENVSIYLWIIGGMLGLGLLMGLVAIAVIVLRPSQSSPPTLTPILATPTITPRLEMTFGVLGPTRAPTREPSAPQAAATPAEAEGEQADPAVEGAQTPTTGSEPAGGETPTPDGQNGSESTEGDETAAVLAYISEAQGLLESMGGDLAALGEAFEQLGANAGLFVDETWREPTIATLRRLSDSYDQLAAVQPPASLAPFHEEFIGTLQPCDSVATNLASGIENYDLAALGQAATDLGECGGSLQTLGEMLQGLPQA